VHYKDALEEASFGLSPNNISAIVKYETRLRTSNLVGGGRHLARVRVLQTDDPLAATLLRNLVKARIAKNAAQPHAADGTARRR
jgi:hypothetical protein